MANKRKLKKRIDQICETLFTECVAVSLYGPKTDTQNLGGKLSSIIHMRNHYFSRVSHPEPGIPAKTYFKQLKEAFNAHVSEMQDLING